MARALSREAIEGLMRGVASALKPQIARIDRRAESTDQLLADLERRLTLAEQRVAALEWNDLKGADTDDANAELCAARRTLAPGQMSNGAD